MTVLVDQSTEDLGPLEGSVAVATDVDVRDRWQLFQRAVWSVGVVVVLVLCQHVPEVSLAEDQHPVEAFATDRAHPPLGIGVGPRRQLHLIPTIGSDGYG